MSLADLSADILASVSLLAPIMISFPDLNMRMVLFGSVFLIMTAGKRLGLYLELSDFWAMENKSSYAAFSLARDTTFWTSGGVPLIFQYLLSRRNPYITNRSFGLLWVCPINNFQTPLLKSISTPLFTEINVGSSWLIAHLYGYPDDKWLNDYDWSPVMN